MASHNGRYPGPKTGIGHLDLSRSKGNVSNPSSSASAENFGRVPY